MNLRARLTILRDVLFARTTTGRLDWLPLLIVRLCLAAVFIPSGWGKLHDLPKVTAFFTELGIPWPHLNAVVVALSELGCGTLMLIGALSRLAAIPLVVSMTIAILTARRGDVHGVADLFALDELIYLALAVVVLVLGAGAISTDGLVARRFFSPRRTTTQPPKGDRS
jgi:putative oxidoreductase